MIAQIIPFPTHKARPGLSPLLSSLALLAQKDELINLWSPHSEENPDRITSKILVDILPENIRERDVLANARVAKDFSILALFAIHSEQWDRKEFLGPLMELQSLAENLVPTKKYKSE